jgi:hypothetical protein
LSIVPAGIGREERGRAAVSTGPITLATTPITSELRSGPRMAERRISPTLIIAGVRQEVLNGE